MQLKSTRLGFKAIGVILCLLGILVSLLSDTTAQAPTLSVGTIGVSAGTTVDLPVSVSAGGIGVSALQFDLTLSPGLSYVSVAAGSVATAAGKSASGKAITGGVRVLIFGLNQNTIGPGIIALVRLTIDSGIAPTTLPVGITGISASSPTATAVPSNGAGGSVRVSEPPVISGISASSITAAGAVINWTTNEVSDSQVEYGTGRTIGYDSSTALISTRVMTHAVQLTGLQASTVYHYRVKSRNEAGNLATSGDFSFTSNSDSIQLPASGTRAAPSPGALFMMSVIENLNFRTNLGINNLSQSRAKVGIVLLDENGIVLGSKLVEVEPRGLKQLNSVARVIYDSAPTQNIEGSLYLESSQPIRAWTSQIQNASNDPSFLLSESSTTLKILIPSAANMSTFRSSLVIMNVGLSRAEVSLRAYSIDGSLLGQTQGSVFIPSNGVLSFENVLQTLGISNNYGPIEITSLNNVPIIACSRVSSPNETGGFFEGLNYEDASLTQIIPHVVDTAELRTNIGINNISDKLATVRVRMFDKNGLERGTTSVIVPPKGLTQLNHAVRLLVDAPEVSALEGYIQLESDQPIFGWASQIDNVTNDPGFVTSRNRGFSRLLLVQSATNVGTFRSSLVVVNTGSSDALVDIVSRDVDGGLQGQLRGLLIPARGFFSSSNILAALGVSSSFGPIEIISVTGQPLLATSRIYDFSGTSGFLQGQPIE